MKLQWYRDLTQTPAPATISGHCAWIYRRLGSDGFWWHGASVFVDNVGDQRIPHFYHGSLEGVLYSALRRSVRTLYFRVEQTPEGELIPVEATGLYALKHITRVSDTGHLTEIRAWLKTFERSRSVITQLNQHPPVQKGYVWPD